jgi:nucleolar protein 15
LKRHFIVAQPEQFDVFYANLVRIPWNKLAGRQLEQPKSETAWMQKIKKEEKRRASRAEKLKALGYEFDTPQLKLTPETTKAEITALEDTEEPPKAIEAPPAADESRELEVSSLGQDEAANHIDAAEVEEVVAKPKTSKTKSSKKVKA